MKVKIGTLELQNPVLVASGTFANGREFENYIDLNKLGGICTTALTSIPKKGNPGRRIYETPSGIMNSIGLQNPGIEEFLKDDLKFLQSLDTQIIVNLSGHSEEEYIKGAELLNVEDIDGIELNISCPNVKEGGMAFGMEPDSARDIVSKVRKVVDKPLIVKLSPNAGDIVSVAKAVEEAGADGISLVNTFNALAVDINTRKPVFDNVTAGLSGPAIKPIAMRMVWQVCKAVDIPVIAIGGIMDYRDVVEYIMVGATAVEIGTANFVNPRVTEEIIADLKEYMKREKIQSLDEIRGIV